MAIKINNEVVIDNNKNINAGVGTFTGLNVSTSIVSYFPTNGSIKNSTDTNIILTFSSPVKSGVGKIRIRNGSSGNSILEEIDVNSTEQITYVGNDAIINPSIELPANSLIRIEIEEGSFETYLGFRIPALNVGQYEFTTGIRVIQYTPTSDSVGNRNNTNITLKFNSAPIIVSGKSIYITKDSPDLGSNIIQTISTTLPNPNLSISGNDLIINPTNDFTSKTIIYVVIPNDAFSNFAGLNVSNTGTYKFTSNFVVGDLYRNGKIVYQQGGTRYIMSNKNLQYGFYFGVNNKLGYSYRSSTYYYAPTDPFSLPGISADAASKFPGGSILSRSDWNTIFSYWPSEIDNVPGWEQYVRPVGVVFWSSTYTSNGNYLHAILSATGINDKANIYVNRDYKMITFFGQERAMAFRFVIKETY